MEIPHLCLQSIGSVPYVNEPSSWFVRSRIYYGQGKTQVIVRLRYSKPRQVNRRIAVTSTPSWYCNITDGEVLYRSRRLAPAIASPSLPWKHWPMCQINCQHCRELIRIVIHRFTPEGKSAKFILLPPLHGEALVPVDSLDFPLWRKTISKAAPNYEKNIFHDTSKRQGTLLSHVVSIRYWAAVGTIFNTLGPVARPKLLVTDHLAY